MAELLLNTILFRQHMSIDVFDEMTGTGIGVKCSGFTEHLVLVQCVLETWWDCTTHEEEDGLGVLELTVQRLLVQGTPPGADPEKEEGGGGGGG